MIRNKRAVFLLITIMTFSLTGCKSTDYKDAIELQNSKDYDSALAIYEKLGDYKDSSTRLNECETMISLIDQYNNAKLQADKKTAELDTAILDATELIAQGKPALDNNLIPKLETAISKAKASKILVPDLPETEDEITKALDDINSIDYSSTLQNLEVSKHNLERSIDQYSLVNAPSESYIISCLSKVPNIIDISAATEDNDPNGHLNKAGGYTSQVFFSSDLINLDEVYGTTVIEKKTTGGGSIEVYSSPEDAKKRNDYLSSFDGSFLNVGSHCVIGTVIVRTSDKLTASQQKEMTANIITTLTTLDY